MPPEGMSLPMNFHVERHDDSCVALGELASMALSELMAAFPSAHLRAQAHKFYKQHQNGYSPWITKRRSFMEAVSTFSAV